MLNKKMTYTIIWMIFIIIITLIIGQAHIYWNPLFIKLDSPDNVPILIGILGVCYLFKKLFEVKLL